MIHQSKISQFCLHYGISIVLIAMFVCVISILQAIEINNKVQVESDLIFHKWADR